jgi:O-acetyl-ADP-ribose deacetylase (regulator of RNase III)
MKEIQGNLLTLAKEGNFDVIIHGCNCFNTMSGGIAKQIKEHFPSAYAVDMETVKGDVNKLGSFTSSTQFTIEGDEFKIINAYTQYNFDATSKPFDYEALTLVLRKLNLILKPDARIGLPQIGAGLAGGQWDYILEIIKNELKGRNVTIVYFKN